MPDLKILNVHHNGYRCRDAQQTRDFWEGILGLPLGAALDFEQQSGTDKDMDYMHLFFQMPDGNFVAFFDIPDEVEENMFERKNGLDYHIAFGCASREELDAWKVHIEAKTGRSAILLEHGFVTSLYFFDPNGIQCEIACKDDNYDEVIAAKSAIVDETMAKWNERTKAKKAERLGAAAP
jgi:catechol 2,3-dioxygenase-like lactoylglutathione lyase family enzyme